MQVKTAPTASEIMKSCTHTIGPEMALADIVAFLKKHDLSSVAVVERQGSDLKLLGFLSEADCLEYMGNELFYGNPSPPETAATIMRKHPTCVSPDTDLFALTSIFTSHRFRQLPVIDGTNLVGIVYRQDVLQAMDEYYGEWIRDKDRYRLPVDTHQLMNLRFVVRS